jgi:hypothetical protein
MFCCQLSGVDADQAIDYLDTTGILEQLTRRMYDIDVAMGQYMQMSLQMAVQSGKCSLATHTNSF